METVDVVVLGMGPGGEVVAGKLAEEGLDVIGIEAALVGGECPYWGCIPSKMMVRAAHLLTEARRVPGMAGSVTVTPDWTTVATRIRDEATHDWDDTMAVERFEGKGGRLVRGRGRLVAPDTVAVGERRFRATRAIVLATGAAPAVPPIDGLADTPFWTNHNAIEATELPNSIVVLCGGAIGSELAQVFARFGVNVTVVEAAPRLLPPEEPEVGALLAEIFRREGITVVTGVAASRVDHDARGFTVRLADDRLVHGDKLLVATGRNADVAAIGADVLGIAGHTRALAVDDRLRVADKVWALGDLTGHGPFTHVALYQADIVIADILNRPHPAADYGAVPRVTFTDPEVGSVGMSVEAATAQRLDVMVGRTDIPSTARGKLHKAGNDGLIILVGDKTRDVLIGATAMGPNGGEVLGLLVLAVHAQVPISTLRTMLYAYPTFHRGIEHALRTMH